MKEGQHQFQDSIAVANKKLKASKTEEEKEVQTLSNLKKPNR